MLKRLDPDTRDRTSIDADTRSRLRRWNVAAAVLHAGSAAAMLALATDFSIPVTLVTGGQPGAGLDQRSLQSVVDVPLAPLVASFMVLSAAFHALVAAPGMFGRYLDELARGRNRFRWAEYALSSTVMIVAIALITSLTDITALIAIAAANVAMILFGWIMEMVNPPGEKVWWTPFWFGTIAGAAPWLSLGALLLVSAGESPPTFVYGILVSIFLLFNCFAVNQFLQYRGIGPWRDYLWGERAYIVLSFAAKSALAWQVYANVLVG
ncbi:MAG: heliorhodopsin HeR [Acidimicrobiales bacterium]